ncbi:MAG TPA: XRE family transcriptional regulator [Syntrophomonas sp.]|nr:XRE family transcriptional regulator [Syntrophomonas sp.]
MPLGETLRRIRENANMNIKQLADETGLTSSHLSQIERNLASPSVSALRKIAESLGVSISTFFEYEEEESGVVVRKQKRKQLKLPDSLIEYQLLSPDFTKAVQLLLTTIKPGAHSSEEPMGHGGEECAVILGGSVQFTVGGETFSLEDGDSIYYNARIPHKFVNTGETEVTIISAISPPGF